MKAKTASFLLLVFSFVAVFVQMLPIEDDQMNMYKALVGLVCLCYSWFVCSTSLKNKVIKYGLLMSVAMSIEIIFIGNARWVNLLWIWSYLGPAMLLFEYGLSRKYALVLFYGVSAYFAYLAIVGEIGIEDALAHGSANYVSILVIFCMSLYYLTFRGDESVELPYPPVLILLFLSLWTASRASILCGGALFLYILVLNYKHANTTAKKIFYYSLVGIIIYAIAWFLINYLSTFNAALEYKMDRQGMESARSGLWKEYFRGLFDEIQYFLFGVFGMDPRYQGLNHYEGNPHNSFLMLHAKYGLIGFFFVIVNLIHAFKKALKSKDQIIIMLLAFVSLRCFFDWNAFPGLFDVLFWFFIFYAKKDPVRNSHVKSSII